MPGIVRRTPRPIGCGLATTLQTNISAPWTGNSVRATHQDFLSLSLCIMDVWLCFLYIDSGTPLCTAVDIANGVMYYWICMCSLNSPLYVTTALLQHYCSTTAARCTRCSQDPTTCRGVIGLLERCVPESEYYVRGKFLSLSLFCCGSYGRWN